MTQDVAEIDAGWTVNDVVRAFPSAVAVLSQFGIDACCGGPRTLDEAARRHGIPLEALVAALRQGGDA